MMVLQHLSQRLGNLPMFRHTPTSRSLSKLSFIRPGRGIQRLTINSTIGAGDTFIAGLLYGLIYRSNDWDFQKRLRFANRLAGLKVGQIGFANLHRALGLPY